jgi:hypothetical protein
MRSPFTRWKRYLTEPVFPSQAWQMSRTSVAGVRFAKKDKSLAARFLAPLPPGVLAPAFDRPNILDAKGLERVLRDGRGRLEGAGGDVSILVPEACVRIFVLGFEGLPASPSERDELFRWRIGKLVPLKPGEMRLGYDVLRSNGESRVVLALGMNEVLGEYESAFARIGLKVRTLSVPTLPLAGLLRGKETGNVLIVNCEEDHVGLLVLLEGEVALYRLKPFLPEAAEPLSEERRRDQIFREIENTMNFLEDKEKKRITAIRVRPTAWPDGRDAVVELAGRWPALSVSEFPGPAALGPVERRTLAPLLGQVS